MTESLKFTIETQTEEGDVISTIHLNEKVVSLKISSIANIMLKKNPDLFNKINDSTKLLYGKVYRQEVFSSQENKNKLNIAYTSSKFKETEIQKLVFKNNFLEKMSSSKNKKGKMIFYNPDLLEDGAGDLNNPTTDVVKHMTDVSSIEQIRLFEDQGIKSFLLTDHLKNNPSLKSVSYRVEVFADTEFEEHVKFVLNNLKKSASFLENFLSEIELTRKYDHKKNIFVKSFTENILGDLGVSSESSLLDFGSNRVMKSDFGKVGISIYNGESLLSSGVSRSIYADILVSIIPSKKTSPEKLFNVIQRIKSLIENIKKTYDVDSKKNSLQTLRVSINKKEVDRMIQTTSNAYHISRAKLGYNLFSEKQKGMNKFSLNDYEKRINSERSKYYPNISIEDSSNFMTSEEKSQFNNFSNAKSFVTPANLVMGDKTITTSRGINNINPLDIASFRIAKSEALRSGLGVSVRTGSKYDISKKLMNGFNIEIGLPRRPILERSVDQEIDPLVDSELYVGSSSYFVTDNPQLNFKKFRKLLNDNDNKILSLVSNIIPRIFLRPEDTIEGIDAFNISSKKSKIRAAVTKKSVNISQIPPHVKSMMSPSFQTNPNIDPLKNRESREIIEETQKNIFIVKAHTGFEVGEDGFVDLNRPIVQDMSEASMTNRSALCKAYNYELPELGIVKDNYMPTIYNNLLYIRG